MSHDYPRFIRRMPRPLRAIGAIIGGVILIAFFALALGAIVMVLWNWLMPSLFGLATINYWQGFGILVLAQLLFGGHTGHRDKSPRRKHSDERIPEGPLFDKWWAREGRPAFEAHIRYSSDGDQASEDDPEDI